MPATIQRVCVVRMFGSLQGENGDRGPVYAACPARCYHQTEGARAPSNLVMRRLLAAALAVSLAAAPLPALAQSQPPADRLGPGHQHRGARASRCRASSARLAADSRARTEGSTPLKLEYRVDVFGTAPALRFFAGQDLRFGGVPSSAPTHADMLYMWTPQAFRSPRVDFLGLALGAAMAGAKKVQDWRYLRDLRNYQRLVESGVNVPAPDPPKQ